jgi:hypothetical protein
MWQFIKNLFQFSGINKQELEGSIHKMVTSNALNKRRNIRIRYPHFGAFGPFPKVTYQGSEMIVGNISVGGLLIIDDTEKFGTTVGEIVHLELQWPDIKVKVRAQIMGVNLQRRHVQFVDFQAAAFLRISKLVKPGYTGSRFHRVHDDIGQLDSLELWVGPTGETLNFTKSTRYAELTLQNEKILFQRGRPALYAKNNEPIPVVLLDDILVMIANLPDASERVKELLEIIEVEMRAVTPKKTGSSGY